MAVFLLLAPSVRAEGVLSAAVAQAVSGARWNDGRDFMSAILQAQRVLSEQEAGFTVVNGVLRDFNVLLAVQKAGGPIEVITLTKKRGTPRKTSKGWENPDGFDIDWSKLNGVNTPFMVAKPDGYVVLALRRVILDKDRRHEVVYTPFTADIDTPSMREAGMVYLQATLEWAEGALSSKKVHSRALPGRMVSDVVPSDVATVLSIIEHIDPARMRREKIEHLIDEVLVTIAANREHAYKYSVSLAHARGLFQFIPRTYTHVTRQYPAGLIIPFVPGMSDHHNAAQATLLLFDSDFAQLSKEWRERLAQQGSKGSLAEYLAAAYNGGSARARAYVEAGGATDRLLPETQVYLAKLHLVEEALGYNWQRAVRP